jgi:transcriptional regulator with XRE-family HTH domain
MLDKFSEELREARTKSGVTLQQMSAKTRIDIKFLEALDRGDFTFMPDPYVKAFLKEYAKMVGLDETKIVSKFEAAKKGKAIDDNEKSEQASDKLFPQKKTYDATPSDPDSKSSDKQNKKLIFFWIGAAVVIILLLVYLIFFKSSAEIIIAEKPYDEVFGEKKDRFVENKIENGIASFSDSLSLFIFSTDTSWVKIILDNKHAEEFILFPNSQKQIKSAENFKITLGNSGGIRFQLNDKQLPFTGKQKAVQHVQIDRDGLKVLLSPPTLQQD